MYLHQFPLRYYGTLSIVGAPRFLYNKDSKEIQ